jgi:hypothetical protein
MIFDIVVYALFDLNPLALSGASVPGNPSSHIPVHCSLWIFLKIILEISVILLVGRLVFVVHVDVEKHKLQFFPTLGRHLGFQNSTLP